MYLIKSIMGTSSTKIKLKPETSLQADTEESENESGENLDYLYNHVFSNHQILGKILCNLDLTSLKNARLVNKFWAAEAARAFLDIVIVIDPSKSANTKLKTPQEFLKLYKPSYTLILSFLDNPWFQGQSIFTILFPGKDSTLLQNCNQTNNPQIHNFLYQTCHLIVELRLQLKLLKREDSKLFAKLFKHNFKSLQRLALDVSDCEDEFIKAIPHFTLPPTTETLGLRMVTDLKGRFGYDGYQHQIRHINRETYSHLLKSLSTIQFLDFFSWINRSGCCSWNNKFSICSDFYQVEHCLSVITEMCSNNPEAFSNLKGLKLQVMAQHLELLLHFPRPLSHLFIAAVRKPIRSNGITLEEIQSIIVNNSQSLKVFNLFWIPNYPYDLRKKFPEQMFQITFPYMPELRVLAFTRICKRIKNLNFKLLDPYNLRDIFLKGTQNLKEVLPSLKTVSLLFTDTHKNEHDLWKHIFPDKTEHGENLQIDQIQNVIISLKAKCNSPHITRFYTIFPELQIFRHVQKQGKKYFCCEHQIRRSSSNEMEVQHLKIGKSYKKLKLELLLYEMGAPNLTSIQQFFWI